MDEKDKNALHSILLLLAIFGFLGLVAFVFSSQLGGGVGGWVIGVIAVLIVFFIIPKNLE